MANIIAALVTAMIISRIYLQHAIIPHKNYMPTSDGGVSFHGTAIAYLAVGRQYRRHYQHIVAGDAAS